MKGDSIQMLVKVIT